MSTDARSNLKSLWTAYPPVVTLRYTGDNADEAVEAFAGKVGQAFPGMKCVASRDATLEPAAIRNLPQP